MELSHFLLSLAVISGSTYLLRAIPFAAVHKKIENPFILSFLDYIPYTVLAAMTLPGALTGAAAPLAAGIGLLVAALVAIRYKSLTLVAAIACLVSYLVSLLLPYFA